MEIFNQNLNLKIKKGYGIEGLEDLGKNQKDMKISGGIKADNKQFEDMNLNIEKSWKAATRARMWPITAQPQKRRKHSPCPRTWTTK